MSRLKALQTVLALAKNRTETPLSKQEMEALDIITEFVIHLQNTRGVETGEF